MTKKIVVEARKDDNVTPIMDKIVEVCIDLGHQVVRWRGPIAGSRSYSRRIPKCDLAIFFNGTHRKYDRYHAKLARAGTPVLFVELGWFPQRGTVQIDPAGINCSASWTRQPLSAIATPNLVPQRDGDLLLLLQIDKDTQITHHSPWFANMCEFVSHVAQSSQLPIRVRPHPRRAPDPKLLELLTRWALPVDRSSSLSAALDKCKAVACVNSSAAVEALARQLPVLCYGNSIYRHEGAVYCLTDDANQTVRITQALKDNAVDLSSDCMDEIVDRIRSKQWRIEDIPVRFPDLLTAMLEPDARHAGSVRERHNVLARLHAGVRRWRRAA